MFASEFENFVRPRNLHSMVNCGLHAPTCWHLDKLRNARQAVISIYRKEDQSTAEDINSGEKQQAIKGESKQAITEITIQETVKP